MTIDILEQIEWVRKKAEDAERDASTPYKAEVVYRNAKMWRAILATLERVAEDRRDAERYRWLRQQDAGCPFAETDPVWDCGEAFDAAIDDAMNAPQGSLQ